MAGVTVKRFDAPDEQRSPDKTDIRIVDLGDAYVINPGHDAWVVGDDAVIGFEFDSSAAETFARPD